MISIKQRYNIKLEDQTIYILNTCSKIMQIYFQNWGIFLCYSPYLSFLVHFVVFISRISINVYISSFIKLFEKFGVVWMILQLLFMFVKFFLQAFNIISLLLHVINHLSVLFLLLVLFVYSSLFAIFDQLMKSSSSSYFLIW